MVASSKTLYVAETMDQSSILNIKANQNVVLDLNLTKYEEFLQLIVECLRYSPFIIALAKSEIVPMVHLSKAYSTASYQKGEELITFESHNQKTHITKSIFCSLLWLPLGRDLIDPESFSNSAILEMFFHMGYKESIGTIAKFKNPNLLRMWNSLFTLLF